MEYFVSGEKQIDSFHRNYKCTFFGIIVYKTLIKGGILLTKAKIH